jgi:hypothetical protein
MRRYLEGSVRDWEVLADIIPVPRADARAHPSAIARELWEVVAACERRRGPDCSHRKGPGIESDRALD